MFDPFAHGACHELHGSLRKKVHPPRSSRPSLLVLPNRGTRGTSLVRCHWVGVHWGSVLPPRCNTIQCLHGRLYPKLPLQLHTHSSYQPAHNDSITHRTYIVDTAVYNRSTRSTIRHHCNNSVSTLPPSLRNLRVQCSSRRLHA